jgi:hypothetical protein
MKDLDCIGDGDGQLHEMHQVLSPYVYSQHIYLTV